MHLSFGAEQAPLEEYEWAFTRVLLAQHFTGWTLSYIDSLSMQDVVEIFAVLEAQDARAKFKRESGDTS